MAKMKRVDDVPVGGARGGHTSKMNQEGKRKRGEDNSMESREGHTMVYSRIRSKGWNETIGFFNVAFKTRQNIVHAIAQAVIEEQICRDTKNFNEYAGQGGGEGSSEDSVDANLYDVPRTKEELDRCNWITSNKREAIQFMLEQQQKHVEGSKVFSPLGNKLPEEKSKWMNKPIMRKALFRAGKHNRAGFASFRGLLDHLQMKQESCIFHRAFLLWICVQGEEGAIFWNKPCNRYRLEDEEAQKRLEMSKALNAPEDYNEYILRHFESMVLGQEEEWRQHIHHSEDIDWDFTERLCSAHKNLRSHGDVFHGDRTCLQIEKLLHDASMRMGELRRGDYGENLTELTLHIVNSLIPKDNRWDYTAMSSMVKMLAKTYKALSVRCVKVTGARIKELEIPSNMTVYDSEGNLQSVPLRAVLENRKTMEIIINSYKTQERTPRKAVPGVPTGRGLP